LRNRARRKQLLIVESEINRHLLMKDGGALVRELHELGERTGQLHGLIAAVIAAFSAAKSGGDAPPPRKRSWTESIFNTVRLGTSLWSAVRNGKRPEQPGHD
jgi:hypothetical protein